MASLRRVLAGLAFAGATAGAAYLALAIARTRAFARRPPPPAFAGPLPSVSVIKPLRGTSAHLRANLRTFVEQDYPDAEIIFVVADPGDAALGVVRELIAATPERRLKVVAGGPLVAVNRKVANLMNGLHAADGEVVVVADADIQVGPQYLRTVVADLGAPGVGLVTCLYGAQPAKGLWSRLGAAFVEERFAPSVLVALAMEPPAHAFGATIALRRTTLDDIGGFGALADTVADDHRLGELVARAGRRVAISSAVVHTVVDEPTLGALWAHELRWARTIRAVRPAGFAGSLLTHGVPLSLAAVALAPRSRAAWGLLLLSFGLRSALGHVARGTFGDGHRRGSAALAPLRDALDFGIWLAAWGGRSARWQDETLVLGRGGRIEPQAGGRVNT